MDKTRIQETLDSLVERYNTPSFADNDPVQFPRRYSDKRDIEISSLLTSTIAWGRRPMILRNAEKIDTIIGHAPTAFILEGDIESIADGNIHRTFFGRHLRYFLRGLRVVYSRYGSLEDFAAAIGARDVEAPSWHIADALRRTMADANAQHPLEGPSRCIPDKPEASALKRFNMALRWLVRQDGIVDIGCWSVIKPDQLFIPLDVHSANTSRALGLLTRRQNDRKAVEELTARLREMRADDPAIYDFALFGFGVNQESGLSSF